MMAASANSAVDCVGLDAFKDFGDYMALVRNRTSFDETLLRQCQVPICGALWGYGLPDISGIGVSLIVSFGAVNALTTLFFTPYRPQSGICSQPL
jgi:hypothetical protein